MLFSEVYGTYFRMVEEIVRDSITGELDQQRILKIVQEKGFEESVLTVPQAFKEQKWPLIDKNIHTKIKHYPTMPDQGQFQFRHVHSSHAAIASFSSSRLRLRYRPGDAPYFRWKRRIK